MTFSVMPVLLSIFALGPVLVTPGLRSISGVPGLFGFGSFLRLFTGGLLGSAGFSGFGGTVPCSQK